MAKRKTVADYKAEIKELVQEINDFKLEAQLEIAEAKERVTKKDFYQGAAWGAGAAFVITVILGIIIF